ncbi:hypothetical protein RLIN73S_06032 [Rhodanobacter lindaniclasticus]
MSAAITTTTALKAMPMPLEPLMKPIEWPKKPITKLARYSSRMPPVAATMPSLNFSVARIRPLR